MSLRERFPDNAARHVHDPELDETDDERASSYLRASFVDSLRAFAPNARVDAFANVRLVGAHFNDGLFDRHAAEILVHLQNEIDAVTDERNLREVQVGFNRIGIGSVVLHLNPTSPVPARNDQLPISSPSVLEQALQHVLDLHDAFEAGDEMLAARRATSDLAARARQLIETLDQAAADIEIDLSRSDGRRRQSRLSEVGRQNARIFFERKPLEEDVVVAGTLRTNSTTGHIELSSGRRVFVIVDVPPDIAKTLQWDRLYRIKVLQRTEAAKAGSKPKVRNKFLRILAPDEF